MNHSRRERIPRRAEGGWVGLLVLLLALLIVAFLSRSALEQYLGGGVTRATAAAGMSGSPDPNVASTPVPSRAPLERARAVEDLVQQQSIEMKKRVEDAEK